jgi:hypothetical protein
MGPVPKTTALLLLVIVAATALPVQVMTAAPALPARMAGGCHQPAAPAHAPRPASYLCCLAGHGSAIPQQAAGSRPALIHLGQAPEFTQRAAAGLDRSPEPLDLYGDSPGISPLRI